MEKVHLVYYSPALSTRKVLRIIGKGTGQLVKEHDITQAMTEPLWFDADDLVIFGVPVYAGRVPAGAAAIIEKIKGTKTPAVIVCVYGNRDYDDALLELKNICAKNDFKAIAGAAFIAQHSIFPKVGAERPDEGDRQAMMQFGEKCNELYDLFLKSGSAENLEVKGNFPYREPTKVPFVPKTNSNCDSCGTCVKRCPVGAINEDNPKKTDKKLCISCARCITICPKKAKKFGGLLYTLVRRKFESAYSFRKEAELFLPD
ncbi:MAG: 4Fe-4S binding protein [Dysgonomonas sp.]|nr:4Fe-4S binding protein [Dysgonomonas sp.]